MYMLQVVCARRRDLFILTILWESARRDDLFNADHLIGVIMNSV